ncbi:hypothetical protein BCON_0599g00040 [Botryotinia convoluta]|uniref:Uncharacterized protein n=1 Tax=Botryotinia convoluta TaxID=54673 RepID=A0A4Z1HG58_9HELO|nr:hypothetical protein BCON_0599g00040 [Botryotinia convoluta]
MGGTPDNHHDTDCGVEKDGDADSDVDAYAQPFEGTEEIEIEEEEGEFCEESGRYEGVAEEGNGLWGGGWVVS